MSVNNPTSEEQLDSLDPSSVDSFIRELEEKEKDLDISSDMVIEVGESDVDHNNIHDTFLTPEDSVAVEPADLQPEPELPAPVEENPELEEKIKQLKVERDKLRDALSRSSKDFENYRTRTDRERSEAFRNAVSNLGAQLLPVLDNLNRALDAFSDVEDGEEKDFEKFLEGIVLVNHQVNDVLSDMGIQPIPAVGEAFDPNVHEAVAIEETNEFPPRTVVAEILRGYRIDDKVIRASMVHVSAEKSKEEESQEDE